MYVALNEVGWRNGQVVLWYNGVQAMNITGLEFRTTADIQSVGGMFFSTFFGGDTTSWASPATQSSYFRNIQMYGGTGASNFTGQRSDAVHTAPVSLRTTVLALVATFLAVAGASLA
jgi:hypothetical protein